jgi:hypothetical protein
MRQLLIAALILTACGTDPSSGDDVGPGPDGAPREPVTIDVMPLCQKGGVRR